MYLPDGGAIESFHCIYSHGEAYSVNEVEKVAIFSKYRKFEYSGQKFRIFFFR